MNNLNRYFSRCTLLLIAVVTLINLTSCDTEPEYVRIKREATHTRVKAIAMSDARIVTEPGTNELIGCIIETRIEDKVWYIKLQPTNAWHLYAGCTPILKGDPLDITKRVMETGQTDYVWKRIVVLDNAL